MTGFLASRLILYSFIALRRIHVCTICLFYLSDVYGMSGKISHISNGGGRFDPSNMTHNNEESRRKRDKLRKYSYSSLINPNGK